VLGLCHFPPVRVISPIPAWWNYLKPPVFSKFDLAGEVPYAERRGFLRSAGENQS